MNQELRPLLREVLNQPEADAPRHLLAQHYRQTNDSRAEFIEAQLKRASLPKWDPLVPSLQEIESQLLGEYADSWAADLGCHELTLGYRRGLAHRVEGTAAALLDEFERVSSRAPIDTLELVIDEEQDGLDQSLGKLGGLEALGCIRRLQLHEADVHPAGLTQLLGLPTWKNLEALELGSCACEPEMVSAIVQAGLPPALTELRCNGQMIGMGDEGLRLLAAAPGIEKIRRLFLQGQGLTDRGLASLTSHDLALRLEELDLASVGYAPNIFGADGLRALLGCPWFPNLKALGLYGCSIAAAAPRALASANSLTSLNLGCTGLQDDPLNLMVELQAWSRIDELSLSSNPLGDAGAETLANCRHLPAILDLHDCDIGAPGLRHLSRAQPVSALDLRNNPIDADAWSEALSSGRLPQTTTLAASASGWSDELIKGIRAHYRRCDLVDASSAVEH